MAHQSYPQDMKQQIEHPCKEIKNVMDYDSTMSTQSTAIQPSTSHSTYSKSDENKWQMHLLVMAVYVLSITIWVFIKIKFQGEIHFTANSIRLRESSRIT
eukprot:712649_1